MALAGGPPLQVGRLAAFGVTSSNADALADFYDRAFDCRRLGARRHAGPAFEALMDVQGGARCVTLALSSQCIEIMQFDMPGCAYPTGSASSDLAFQHFAIVVADMDDAYRRLRATPGWSAISTDGPQRLPDAAGGVTAFKFRDPEGHPLELLAFPQGASPRRWRVQRSGDLFLGIDHSALSVSDSVRSVRFYQGLGLTVSGQSLNSGPEQQALDAVDAVQVEVTALSPFEATPHLELLGYRHVVRAAPARHRSNDIVASRLVLESIGPPDAVSSPLPERRILDPDGHHLIITPGPDERRFAAPGLAEDTP